MLVSSPQGSESERMVSVPLYLFAEPPKTFSHHIRAGRLFLRADRVTLVSCIHSVSSTNTPSNGIWFR